MSAALPCDGTGALADGELTADERTGLRRQLDDIDAAAHQLRAALDGRSR